MSGDLYLGLDVGTQGTKGVLFSATSRRVVARASRAYGLLEGLPQGAAEQHPETWTCAVAEVASDLLRAYGVPGGRLAGVGVSGQQHGFVPLDEQGRVIRAAKLWCDTSTAKEALELSRQFGRNLPAGFTASKILWLKRHEPENFLKLRHVLLPHDYINFRLTGRMCMEAGDASGTGFFDPETRAFCVAELRTIDDALPGMFPELLEAGEPAGRVTSEAAEKFGLPEGLLVAGGGGDNMMSALGSGATREGVIVLSLGTSGTVFTYSSRPVVDPAGLIAPFCDSTGGWLPLLCVMNLTGVAEEVRKLTGGGDHATLTRAAEGVEAGCGGLQFIPYLQGERVPDLPLATGSIHGIRPGLLTAAGLYRAALEATSLNLAWGVSRMRALGLQVDGVRLVGGGAGNRLWRSILADTLNAPVQRLEETESAALGAALCACWTDRRQTEPDLAAAEVAASAIRLIEGTDAPDPDRVRVYSDLLDCFRRRVAESHGDC